MNGWMDGQWMQRECERRELLWPNHGFYPDSQHWADLTKYRINSRDGIGRRQLPNEYATMHWKGEAIWSAMTQSYSAMRQKVLFWEKLDYIWHQRPCVSKQPWESNRQVGRSHRLPWANPVLPWEAANAAMRPQWGGGLGWGWGDRVKQPWKPSDRNLHTGIKNCP